MRADRGGLQDGRLPPGCGGRDPDPQRRQVLGHRPVRLFPCEWTRRPRTLRGYPQRDSGTRGPHVRTERQVPRNAREAVLNSPPTPPILVNIPPSRHQTVQAMNESYEILFGSDQQMESAAVFGAAGFVGSTYNYAGTSCDRHPHGTHATAHGCRPTQRLTPHPASVARTPVQSTARRPPCREHECVSAMDAAWDCLTSHLAPTAAALAEQRRSQAFVRVMFKYSSSNVNGNKAIAQLRTGVRACRPCAMRPSRCDRCLRQPPPDAHSSHRSQWAGHDRPWPHSLTHLRCTPTSMPSASSRGLSDGVCVRASTRASRGGRPPMVTSAEQLACPFPASAPLIVREPATPRRRLSACRPPARRTTKKTNAHRGHGLLATPLRCDAGVPAPFDLRSQFASASRAHALPAPRKPKGASSRGVEWRQ